MKGHQLGTCTGCGRRVLRIRDVDTAEDLTLDADPVDGGCVTVIGLLGRGLAFARRYGQPQRRPAFREHHCPGPTVDAPVADPYEDAPAAEQQHGGWRQ